MLSSDQELVKGVQTELGRLGILDPPADEDFGPVSVLGWQTFLSLAEKPKGTTFNTDLTPQRARLLLSSDPAKLLQRATALVAHSRARMKLS